MSSKKYLSYKEIGSNPKFIFYLKEGKTVNGATPLYFLDGIVSSKGPEYIHRQIDKNTFERKLTRVTKGYEKQKPHTKKWIKDHYWNPVQKPITRKKVPEYSIMKWYNTHDNGGTPYIVYVNSTDTKAIVYRIPKKDYFVPEEMYENWRYKFPDTMRQMFHEKFGIFEGKVFIGEAPCRKQDEGNSILVKTGARRYTYIGTDVYKFTIPQDDEIIRYFSLMGNNDVPYPVALGKKYVYIIGDGFYYSRKDIKFKKDYFECSCCSDGKKGRVYGKKDRDILYADAYYNVHHGDSKGIEGTKMKNISILSKREIDRYS